MPEALFVRTLVSSSSLPLFIIINTHFSPQRSSKEREVGSTMNLDSVRNKWLDGAACMAHSQFYHNNDSDYTVVLIVLSDPYHRDHMRSRWTLCGVLLAHFPTKPEIWRIQMDLF